MTAPDQPAPPAPTPTMAEACKHFEDRIAWLVVRLRQLEGLHLSADPMVSRGLAMDRLALSAMRAVEAGPVATARRDGDDLVITATRDFPVTDGMALYAFPSPDGGSAT